MAEEVEEKVLHSAFIPFGDITDINIPLDYETGKWKEWLIYEKTNHNHPGRLSVIFHKWPNYTLTHRHMHASHDWVKKVHVVWTWVACFWWLNSLISNCVNYKLKIYLFCFI